jgi:transmembrane sensor
LAGALLILRVIHGPLEGTHSAWEGASLQTAADTLAVTLVDGSSLRLDPGSRVEMGEHLPSAVKLILKEGRLTCDVTHRPQRSFLVEAADVEVRVVGTRFSVSTSHAEGATRVEVQVERGVVEVRGRGLSDEPVRLVAGRSWSRVTRTSELASPAAQAKPAAKPAESPEAAAQGSAPTGTIDPAPVPIQAAAHGAANKPSSRVRFTHATSKAEQGTIDVKAPANIPANVPAKAAPAPVSQSDEARALFEKARVLWREGRIRDAAASYEALLLQYPHDGRAGLAAFELGRLRMDRLADMDGAAQALERAVALAPSAGLREDAMARLVSARAGAHDQAGCARARDAYLERYPSGMHRRRVVSACAAP